MIKILIFFLAYVIYSHDEDLNFISYQKQLSNFVEIQKYLNQTNHRPNSFKIKIDQNLDESNCKPIFIQYIFNSCEITFTCQMKDFTKLFSLDQNYKLVPYPITLKKQKIIFIGREKYREILIGISFNSELKTIFLYLQQLTSQNQVKLINSLNEQFKLYIEEIQRLNKLKDSDFFYNIDNLFHTWFYKNEENLDQVIFILYYDISTYLLYIELDISKIIINTVEIKEINENTFSSEQLYFNYDKFIPKILDIIYYQRILVFQRHKSFFIINADYMIKNIKQINIADYTLPSKPYNNNFPIRTIDYLGDNLFLLSDNINNYLIMEHIIKNQIIMKSFYHMKFQLDCEKPFKRIYSNKIVGCVYLKKSLTYQKIIYKRYRIIDAIGQDLKTYENQIDKNIFFEEDNFYFDFKEELLYIYLGINVIIFQDFQNDNQVQLPEKINNQIVLFDNIIHNVYIFDFYRSSFAEIQFLQNFDHMEMNIYKKYEYEIKELYPNISKLVGVQIQMGQGVIYEAIIIRDAQVNTIYLKRDKENTLVMQKGALYKEKIIDVHFKNDLLYVMYQQQFGYYDFKKTKRFMQIDVQHFEYKIFLPLNLIFKKQNFLAINQKYILILEGNKQVYKILLENTTEQFYKFMMIEKICMSYDPNYPQYVFLFGEDNTLCSLYIQFNMFFSVEIYCQQLIDIEFQYNNSFFNVQNKLYFINVKKQTILPNKYSVQLIVLKYNQTFQVIYTYIFQRSFCNQKFIHLSNNKNNQEVMVICLKEQFSNEENLYYFQLNQKNMYPMKLNIDLKPNMQVQYGIGKQISHNEINDTLIVYQYNKKYHDAFSYISIYQIFLNPFISYYKSKNEYLFDNKSNYILIKQNNQVLSSEKLTIIGSCFTNPNNLKPKILDVNNLKVFYDNNKEIFNLSFNPRRLFSGNISSISVRLNNTFENFLKIFSIQPLYQHTIIKFFNPLLNYKYQVLTFFQAIDTENESKNKKIKDLQKDFNQNSYIYAYKNTESFLIYKINIQLNFHEQYNFNLIQNHKILKSISVIGNDYFAIFTTNNRLIFLEKQVIPYQKVIKFDGQIIYNFDLESIMNYFENIESFYQDNYFYFVEDHYSPNFYNIPIVYVNKAEDLNFQQNYSWKYEGDIKGFNFTKIDIIFDFTSYELFIQDDYYMFMFKEYPIQKQYNYLLVFKKLNNIELINFQQFQIKFYKVTCFGDKDKTFIVRIQENFGFKMTYYEKQNQVSIFQHKLNLNQYFLNQEVLQYYQSQILNLKIKCQFIEENLECIMVFKNADSIYLLFQFQNDQVKNVINLQSLLFFKNFAFQRDAQDYNCIIGDKFYVLYYLINSTLELYVYYKEDISKRVQKDIICLLGNDKRCISKENQIDFCSENIEDHLIDTIQVIKIPHITTLKQVKFIQDTLVLVTQEEIHEINLKEEITFSLYKKNIQSTNLVIEAQFQNKFAIQEQELKKLDENVFELNKLYRGAKICIFLMFPFLWTVLLLYLFKSDRKFEKDKQAQKKNNQTCKINFSYQYIMILFNFY